MPTILLKRSNTPGSIPSTANLTNLAGGVEVAVNTADRRMFTMTSASAVVEVGTNPSSLTVSNPAVFSAGTAAAPAITTTGDTNTGMFFPAADTIAFSEGGSETMRLDSSGNVGIGGAAAASVKVDILGTLPSSGGNTFGFGSEGTIPSSTTSLYAGFACGATTAAASFTLTDFQHYRASQVTFGAGSTVTNQYGFFVNSNLTGATNNYGFFSNIASGSNRWNFYANGTANNYFAGNVGIGVVPGNKLDISGNQGFSTASYVFSYAGGTSTQVRSGLYLDGTNQVIQLLTATNERARISATGGFSVGTTADPGVGAIFATGNITAYYSDARLKDFKGKIGDALYKISQLNGYYYTENAKAEEFGYNNKTMQVGVSAQEVKAVLPEVVSAAPFDLNDKGESKSGENYMTVNYEKLVPLLIEAIKELKAEVDALKGK